LGILVLSRRSLATTGGSTFFTSEMEKVATAARGDPTGGGRSPEAREPSLAEESDN